MTVFPSERDPLWQLAIEFLQRSSRGEQPRLEEFLSRCPEREADIESLFPTLLLLTEIRPEAAPSRPLQELTWPGEGIQRLGDYRILREIGRGGMGVVYEAEQQSLGRRVALKVLPAHALSSPQQAQRFQAEARAAARLHHSNIVPVFGCGLENGTWYYAMQYIDGYPLDQVLDRVCQLRATAETERISVVKGKTPRAEDERDVFHVRSMSEGPCPAADVAHSLWTGQFRTPQEQKQLLPDCPDHLLAPACVLPVQNTGMGVDSTAKLDESARVLSDPRRSFACNVARLGVQVADALEYAAGQGVLHRDVKPSNLLLDAWGTVWLTDFGLAKAVGEQNLTSRGDVFGTLRYLAPERFSGQSDIRSDIYALGLTLYELLVLKPGYDEPDRARLVQMILESQLERLDRLDPHLPTDLVTIIHKAIARDPAERYQSAGALAEDLRAFLQDRPITARRISVLEQARRWCRRNPAGATLMALALTVVLMAVGGGLWLDRQQAQTRVEAARRQERARQAVAAGLEQAAVLQRQGSYPGAKALLEQAETRLEEADSDDLAIQLKQAKTDLSLASRLEAIRFHRAIPVKGKLDPVARAREYTDTFAEFGLVGEEESLARRIRESAIREQLLGALDDWAFTAVDPQRTRLLQLARRIDPDPKWRDRFRDPAVWHNRQALERLAAEAPVAQLSPQLLAVLGALLRHSGGDAAPLLRAAQQGRPADFWLNFELGNVLTKNKPADAVGFYRVALAVRPHSSAVHTNLGTALYALGQREEAIAEYRRAIGFDPQDVLAYQNLGIVLKETGDWEGAVTAGRRAIELDPDAVKSYQQLALNLQCQGQWEEASSAYQRAIALDLNQSGLHFLLGNVLLACGKSAEAAAAYRRAIQLSPRLATAYWALGQALNTQGDFAEAREATQGCLDLLPATDPTRKAVQQQLNFCKRFLALDARLADVLAGKGSPANPAEKQDLGLLCAKYKRRYATAARLCMDAFTAEPRLAESGTPDRQGAARAAVLAAAGQGVDAGKLDRKQREQFRRQALEWLRAERQGWARRLAGGNVLERAAVGEKVRHALRDGDLSSVRDRGPAGLDKLPEMERMEWRGLWADIESLLAGDPLGRGRETASHMQWTRSAEHYNQALALIPLDDGSLWFEAAAVRLLSGDIRGYRDACEHMVHACGKAPAMRPALVARAYTLAPESVKDIAAPGQLAAAELKSHGRACWSLTQQAALHYRAGRFAEAVGLLRQSLLAEPRSGHAILNWLWLALANQRLGKTEEARRWLDQSRKWLDRNRDRYARGEGVPGLHLHNWLEAQVLRLEAETLLKGAP